MKSKLQTALFLIMAVFLTHCKNDSKPNVVLIFADDMGYGDLAVYGNKLHQTPHFDRMAEDGLMLTDFYVTSGVCTPSRSSLMTGCYPRRISLHVNERPFGTVGRQVLFGKAHKGLHPDEITLAEILKSKGYATACIGKWHLGDQPPFLPTRQGFDYYYGIPYSNDMTYEWCPTPLMRNEEVIEAPVDQNTLTQRYTAEAISFIEAHHDQPFFVYLPHSMVHNPLHASDSFRGKSENGIYGDAVQEMDWSIGEIRSCLERLALADHTLIIFTSDNGAARPFGGSNAPLSGWKGSTMEGGMREPCLMVWPDKIKAGSRSSELVTSMDIVPTLANIVGYHYPDKRTIDGQDIYAIMTREGAPSPTKAFYYYQLEHLQAVRSGKWKLLLPLDSMYVNIHQGTFGAGRPMQLIDLEADPAESIDVSNEHPDVVERLLAFAEEARRDLGDLGVEGQNTREAGFVANPAPQLLKR